MALLWCQGWRRCRVENRLLMKGEGESVCVCCVVLLWKYPAFVDCGALVWSRWCGIVNNTVGFAVGVCVCVASCGVV